MPEGDRRLDPRSSTLLIFAVSTAVAIAVGVLTYQPIPDVQGADRDVGTVEQAGVSPRCAEADRASVAELAAVLERHDPGGQRSRSARPIPSASPGDTASTVGTSARWTTTRG